MNRHRRTLMTIRIVVILLVGLAFLIARFAKGQQPSAARLLKRRRSPPPSPAASLPGIPGSLRRRGHAGGQVRLPPCRRQVQE